MRLGLFSKFKRTRLRRKSLLPRLSLRIALKAWMMSSPPARLRSVVRSSRLPTTMQRSNDVDGD